jgi:hypothetical protein
MNHIDFFMPKVEGRMAFYGVSLRREQAFKLLCLENYLNLLLIRAKFLF